MVRTRARIPFLPRISNLEGQSLLNFFRALVSGAGLRPPPPRQPRMATPTLTYYVFCWFAYKNYDNCSFSIYKKSDAIAIAGKTSPTRGTKIDGRFKLIIEIQF